MASERNIVKDKVYLFQFGRARCVPSLSPYSLKVETWLRMNNIDYKNRHAGLSGSERGQKPYIEFNGEQIADSTNIINFLTEKFEKGTVESTLSLVDRAVAHAFDQMMDHVVFWQVVFLRSLDLEKSMFSKGSMLDALPPLAAWIPVWVMGWLFGRALKPRMDAQGVGRRPVEENVRMTIENIKAFSAYLGKKKFMTGNQPTRYDATAFGIMGQLYFTTMDNEVVTFLKTDDNVENVRTYFENIKSTYFPDWKQICDNLKLNTDWQMSK